MSDVDRLNLRTSRMRPFRYLERAAKSRRAVLAGPPRAGLRAPRDRFCTGLLVCAAMAASGGVHVGGKEWSKGGRPAQDRPRHDPVIETLAMDAAGVAPEFAADALIRIASSPRVTDPSRARELFEWIDLNLAPGACEDPLVPAVDEYYGALSLLARTTFGADRGEALRFLELYLWRAQLPSEMPAVARALERFRPRPDEAAYLEALF